MVGLKTLQPPSQLHPESLCANQSLVFNISVNFRKNCQHPTSNGVIMLAIPFPSEPRVKGYTTLTCVFIVIRITVIEYNMDNTCAQIQT